MEDINHQEQDSIEIDNDVNIDGEDEVWEPSLELDKDILQRLKENDPSVTHLNIPFRCNDDGECFFNTIDWEKDGDCISNNKHLKTMIIYYTYHSITYEQSYMLGEEGHNLPTRQQLQDFFSCIYCNNSIYELKIHAIDINDDFGGDLIEGLQGHPSLTKLEIKDGSLGNIGCPALGKVLTHAKSRLKVLHLNRSISSAGWQTFINHVSQTSIEELNLEYTRIEDADLSALVNVRTLKSLNVSSVTCTPAGWQSFFNLLQTRRTQLVKFGISGSTVGDIGVVTALVRLLSNMSSLKTLEMGNMAYSNNDSDNITSQGWLSFFVALQDSNLDLVELDVHCNQIDDEGLQLLIRLASSMSSLKVLSLSQNQLVTPAGWQVLTGYLQSPNFTLRKLDLDGNNINDDTVVALTSALAHNTTLERLCLDECADEDNIYSITERGWEAVSTLVCKKTSIMDTYSSNHTLHKLCHDDDDDDNDNDDDYNEMRMNLPGNLLSYVEMNENKDKVEVARQKILQTHFSGDASKVQVLLDVELEVIPIAIAWFGRQSLAGWKGTSVSGLSPLYNLTRRLPDLFDSDTQKIMLQNV